LELTEIPKSLIVMGAGAVGVEFASVYSRFGAETTIVELLPRLVPLEDEEVSAELAKSFRKRGIKSQVDTKLEKLEKTDTGVIVTGKTSKGEDVKLEAEMLLVAVGRMPFTEGLGLEKTKIKVEKGFIQTDEYQQTSEKGVYAIGDVVPTPLLAHLASREGIVAVEHLAGKNPRPINLRLVPNCTYCDPEVASVGLTEAKARELGYDVLVGKFPFSASDKARIIGEEEGFVKIVSEKKYDEILGVHIIGLHATELIEEACVAMQLESTADELGRTMHAHQTISEAVMEATAVGSAYALQPQDFVTPLIRDLGAVLVKGIRPREIFAQYMAKAWGPSGGKDLNIHFGDVEKGFIGPISHLGDMIPVMTGVLLGGRLQKKKFVAIAYIGDGGMSTGAFHEGLNFAAVQRLPLIVIAEHNHYAYSTPTNQQTAVRDLAEKAAGYGIPAHVVDGNDIIACYEVTKQAAE